VLIKHVKARFAEPGEFELAFDRRIQKFTSIGEAAKGVGCNDIPSALM
jgi:hypothetical protein